MSCPTNSRPKTRRESAPCFVANPRQVSNLAVVRALPGADSARFPIGHGVLLTAVKAAFSYATVIPRTSETGHDYVPALRRPATPAPFPPCRTSARLHAD